MRHTLKDASLDLPIFPPIFPANPKAILLLSSFKSSPFNINCSPLGTTWSNQHEFNVESTLIDC